MQTILSLRFYKKGEVHNYKKSSVRLSCEHTQYDAFHQYVFKPTTERKQEKQEKHLDHLDLSFFSFFCLSIHIFTFRIFNLLRFFFYFLGNIYLQTTFFFFNQDITF